MHCENFFIPWKINEKEKKNLKFRREEMIRFLPVKNEKIHRDI